MTFGEAMELQAQLCDANGAPVTARVCRALAGALNAASETGARALVWGGDYITDAVPLRLVAGLNALHRAGRYAALGPLFRGEATDGTAAVGAAIAAHDREIGTWLDSPPQTNEPMRSAVFAAGLLWLTRRFARPFALLEIGSSAGLNLLMDRYHYCLGGVATGPRDAALTLAPDWRGTSPPSADVRIASLRGVDIAPLDLRDPAAAERLLAYVWVDAPERLARVATAIALWHAQPPQLDRGDAADWVDAQLAEPPTPGVASVIMHSVVWPYVSAKSRRRIAMALDAAGTKATAEMPLAWMRYEWGASKLAKHELRIKSWPGGDDVLLAYAHPHGAWIEWLGQEGA